MNKKLKNMEYLLNFGSAILTLSLIFIIFNLGDNLDLVKFILGSVSGCLLVGISSIIENKLKLPGSAKIFYFEGVLTFLWFFIFAGNACVFGEWFSEAGEGSQIFYAVLYFLITALFILTHIRFKNYTFINISYISTILGIYCLFEFLSLSFFEITLLLMTLLILLFVFTKEDKKYKFYRNILSVFMLIMLFAISANYEESLLCLVGVVLEVISILIVAIKSKDNESKYYCLVIYYYLMGIITNVFDSVIDPKILLVLVVATTCFIDLAINYFIKYFGDASLKFNKFIFPIFIYLMSIYASELADGLFVTVTLLTLIASIGILIMFKGDSFEKYVFPLKLGFFLFSVMYLVSNHLFVIPSLVYIFILNLLYLIFYLRTKDKKLKIEYTVIAIFLMIAGLNIGADSNVVNFLSILFMMLLDYLILIISSDRDSTTLGKAMYIIVLVASLISVGSYDIGAIRYLIETIFLLVLFISNDKIKLNVGITLPLICFSLCSYMDEVITNDIVQVILNNLMLLITTGLFSYYIFDGDNEDKFFAVAFALIEIVFLFSITDMILSIYALSVIVAVILLAFKINYKASYTSGIVVGIISLLLLINSIEGMSASIYLLILGFGVIAFAIYMISKYNKDNEQVNDTTNISTELKEIKEDKQEVIQLEKICSDCGEKIPEGNKFCGKCGKKVD